jgi:dienelactone hydrolase
MTVMKSRVAVAAAITPVLLAACSVTIGARSGPTRQPDRTAAQTPNPGASTRGARPEPGVIGRYPVGQHELTFVEPAHVGVTGTRLSNRRLVTWTWYPLAAQPAANGSPRPAAGPFPMIVFGPGFMQCSGPYSRLLRSVASAGYVVVAVDFPRSDCKVGGAATEADMVNQPGDMSFVITRMLVVSAARRGLFSGLIDRREIGVAGQSDGGDTVAALAANTCCGDHRVRAVAVYSGAEWPPMPGRYFTRRPVPMLLVQGTADTVNPPGCSVTLYHADPTWARYYLDLFGATHTGPYWGSNRFERVVARVSVVFFDRFLLGHAAAGPMLRRAGDVPRVAALLAHGGGTLPPGPPCNT